MSDGMGWVRRRTGIYWSGPIALVHCMGCEREAFFDAPITDEKLLICPDCGWEVDRHVSMWNDHIKPGGDGTVEALLVHFNARPDP